VFALCYEGSFYFFLGIELRQILTLTDIVESSVLKIAPAIPLFILGAWVGSAPPLEKATNLRQHARNFVHDLPIKLISWAVNLSAIVYFLFGRGEIFGFPSLILVTFVFFGKLVILPLLDRTNSEISIGIWLILIAALAFTSMGYTEAHKIRFGDHSKLPIVSIEMSTASTISGEVRLVRRLSSGILVTNEVKERLLFIFTDNSSILTFKIDGTPFRGVLCGGFGFCPSIFFKPDIPPTLQPDP